MPDTELDAVESVLTALVLAEGEPAFQKRVTALLPALLSALSTKSDAARKKCFEALNHINVRVRAIPNLILPFSAVLKVATAPDASSLTVNVAIIGGYLARCLNSLPRAEQAEALPDLLRAQLALRSDVTKAAVHALALRALHAAAKEEPSTADSGLWKRIADSPEEAVQAFFAYGLLALRQKLEKPVPEALLLPVVRLASEYAGIKCPERAVQVFPHLLVAAGSSGRTALCTAGEDAMKKVDTCDVLAAEDPSIADTLLTLFSDPLADISLRIVLLGKGLLRVTMCASCFPEVFDVMTVSLLTPGIPARLQALGMQFVSFVVANSAEDALESNAKPFTEIMMKLVQNETNGSPSFSDKLRGFGYTGLADMIVRLPGLMGKMGVTPQLFFEAAMSNELPVEVRASASHALVTLTRVIRVSLNDSTEFRSNILTTLVQTVENSDDVASSARAAAVQWANECFAFADCDARLINIIAASDTRQDVRQHALYGLSVKRWASKEKMAKDDDSMTDVFVYPAFSKVVATFSKYSQEKVRPQSMVAYLSFALSTVRHAVARTSKATILRSDRINSFFEESPEEMRSLAMLKDSSDKVLTSQSPARTAGLERAALSVLLFSSHVASLRKIVSATYSSRMESLVALIEKKSALGDIVVARALSILVGIASENLSESNLFDVLGRVGAGIEPDASGVASGRHGEDQRAAKIFAIGQIIARSLRGATVTRTKSYTDSLSEQCLHIIRRATLAVDSSDVVRTAACAALGDIGAQGPLPVSLASRGVAVNSLSGAIKVPSLDARLAEAAADALGRVCVGEPRKSFKTTVVEALINVCRERKEDEIRFTAAESLVRCSSGYNAPPPLVTEGEAASNVPSSQSSDSEDLVAIMLINADSLKVRDDIDDESDGSEREQSHSIAQVVRAVVKLCQNERPNARAGGCVCLFTFLRLLGSKTEASDSAEEGLLFASQEDEARHVERRRQLSDMLPEIQQAFTILLGDRSDFVQQLASCGIALVYDMCPPKQQRDLVSTLVRSLTMGKSKAASTVPGDQGSLLELRGPNVAQSSGAGRSGTYKELCALAQDMGQPELVYKFMDLAGHTALWNNRRGAALAGSALLDSEVAAEQLRPHLKTLLPRLYVYCYDPTEGVRMAMGSVLGAVLKASGISTVAEGISDNYDLVTKYCLKAMTSRQWRSREAACGALRDALVSRTWDQVKDLMSEFWYVTLRALDDIKESVRKSAGGTGRALSELSVYLCDPAQVGVDVASQAIAVVIPAVLPAFTHAVAEVRVLATKTLSDVIRLGGSALTSSVPDLVEALLEAATELEPQVLNYAQFHVDSKEELQKARVDAASMSDSPLIDSLERLAGLVDESVVEQLIPKLTRMSRMGVGIPTRAATARFFSTLLRSRAAVVEPYAGRLMFAATAASGMELNAALRALWCTAVGAGAKLSKTDDVRKLVDKIVEYSGSEDPQERSLASSLAAALWRKSPDTARQHASAMLPIAYMGRYETDEDARGAGTNWKEVWGEGAPSTEAGLRLYAKEITTICENRLATSAQYRVKRSAAAALGALAAASNESVDVRYLAASAKALVSCLPGHIWDGKIAALDAIGTIATFYSNLDVWAGAGGAEKVVRVLLRESQRGKKDYRLAAIASASKLLERCRDKHHMFSEVWDNLKNLWNTAVDGSASGEADGALNVSRVVWETGTDADAVNARNKARKAQRALCAAAVTCIESSYASAEKPEYQAEDGGTLIGILETSIRGDWEVRLVALQSLKRMTSRSGVDVLLSKTSSTIDAPLFERVVELALVGILDAKYAAIRRAGLETLLALKDQAGEESVVKSCLSPQSAQTILMMRERDDDSGVQSAAKKVSSAFKLTAGPSTSGQ